MPVLLPWLQHHRGERGLVDGVREALRLQAEAGVLGIAGAALGALQAAVQEVARCARWRWGRGMLAWVGGWVVVVQ